MAGQTKTIDTCADELNAMGTFVLVISIVPIVFSIISIALIVMTIWKVKNMITLCDCIASSAHWLSRTAVRVGIGASAKTTIAEYAKTKPEMSRFQNLK